MFKAFKKNRPRSIKGTKIVMKQTIVKVFLQKYKFICQESFQCSKCEKYIENISDHMCKNNSHKVGWIEQQISSTKEAQYTKIVLENFEKAKDKGITTYIWILDQMEPEETENNNDNIKQKKNIKGFQYSKLGVLLNKYFIKKNLSKTCLWKNVNDKFNTNIKT